MNDNVNCFKIAPTSPQIFLSLTSFKKLFPPHIRLRMDRLSSCIRGCSSFRSKGAGGGDARSRLRMAYEWLRNWARLTPEERENELVSDQDIVELTLAHLNIHGPKDAAESLKRWKPREISYRVGRLVTRRLIDHGRWSDVEAIARAAETILV